MSSIWYFLPDRYEIDIDHRFSVMKGDEKITFILREFNDIVNWDHEGCCPDCSGREVQGFLDEKYLRFSHDYLSRDYRTPDLISGWEVEEIYENLIQDEWQLADD